MNKSAALFCRRIVFFVLVLSVISSQAKDSKNTKIVGGQNSPKTPYQISLQVRTRRQAGLFNNIFSQNDPGQEAWAHNCGGSIVSKK